MILDSNLMPVIPNHLLAFSSHAGKHFLAKPPSCPPATTVPVRYPSSVPLQWLALFSYHFTSETDYNYLLIHLHSLDYKFLEESVSDFQKFAA